jgi:hypothetical protein
VRYRPCGWAREGREERRRVRSSRLDCRCSPPTGSIRASTFSAQPEHRRRLSFLAGRAGGSVRPWRATAGHRRAGARRGQIGQPPIKLARRAASARPASIGKGPRMLPVAHECGWFGWTDGRRLSSPPNGAPTTLTPPPPPPPAPAAARWPPRLERRSACTASRRSNSGIECRPCILAIARAWRRRTSGPGRVTQDRGRKGREADRQAAAAFLHSLFSGGASPVPLLFYFIQTRGGGGRAHIQCGVYPGRAREKAKGAYLETMKSVERRGESGTKTKTDLPFFVFSHQSQITLLGGGGRGQKGGGGADTPGTHILSLTRGGACLFKGTRTHTRLCLAHTKKKNMFIFSTHSSALIARAATSRVEGPDATSAGDP